MKVGVDIASVHRFRRFKRDRTHPFLKNFTERELVYCFAFADPATHLAGTFAAKEAVNKVFSGKFSLREIEIVRQKDGPPTVWRKKKKMRVSVSISHEGKLAIAAALR